MTVPSLVPTILNWKNIRDRRTEITTQATSKIIFILDKLIWVVSETAFTKASPEIRKPSEKERKRNLQKLDPLKVPAQNQNLTEDQETVPDDEQGAKRPGRIFATDDICNGGGR